MRNKSALSAALITLFLGCLGIHRFYLNRTFSGVVILVFNLATFGLGLIVTAPVVFSEFIYYTYLVAKRRLSERTVKSALASSLKDQMTAINHKFKEEMQANNAQFKENISLTLAPPKVEVRPVVNKLNIIEVSDMHPEPIQRPASSPRTTNWIRLLEIPYERQGMQVPQIKQETLKLFEAICNMVDEELHKGGETLLDLKRELDQSGQYYGNILYTFYCIAEGEVQHHYKASGYDNAFSYDILRRHTNPDFVDFVNEFCVKYVEQLPMADETTRAAYHLTKDGLQFAWWDEDGSIRTKHSLTPTQVKLLDRTPYRSTVMLNIPEVRLLVLAQYLSTMSVLHQYFKSSAGWPPKTVSYLSYLFGKRSSYYSDDYTAARIAQYTLKLCEQTVRQNIPYSRLLKTDIEIADIKEIAPEAASRAILDRASHLIKPITLKKETVDALRELNPQAWKRDIAALAGLDINDCTRILEWYREDPEFTRIARQAIKHTLDDPIKCLISCYAYCTTIDETEKSVLKILHSIIVHPLQQKEFMKLAHQHLPFDDALSEQLKALMKAPVRTIELDIAKVNAARAAHEEALKQVSGYLGEGEQLEPEEDTSAKPQDAIILEDLFNNDHEGVELSLDVDQLDFLHQVVEAKFEFDVSRAELFARSRHKLLGSLVQSINKQYYDMLEDQLLCTVNDKITVEEIYHKQVKETLGDHNSA